MRRREVIEDSSTAALIPPREAIQLDEREAMRLLASVDHGRVVFNDKALPTIRLVNHLVDGGRIIVRTRLAAKVSTVVRRGTNAGVVVAYEVDRLDPERRAGWSVAVTGWATTITDPRQVARYEQLLHPWVNMTMDTMIAIQPEIITGIRIVDAAGE
ncbi:hypothetical protein ABW17_03990 [Mycobacterium nebraskense]|uniref:pyridoxamine 5'-phosphate oxidase family protein n=1 Tax=Mycobacterium nebraskense TaxID=244292 RepID=UPI0006425DEC|nr:pyridoxamine 5'-phosphate oxidase family protein [Mycobacterium nebraskense]KLO46471.1 hypothetical protein ABW17_03990 [Mycobacterium nebraskense]